MAKVFYVGSFRFPNGDAAAGRVLAIGKALRQAGHEVVFGGWENEGRSEDFLVNVGYVYQGFRYVSLNEFRRTEVPPFRRLFEYVARGSNTLRWLETQLKAGDAVIAYEGNSAFCARLYSLCRKRNVSLTIDCTEWYCPDHLVGGRYGLVRWDEELRMRFLIPKITNVIAVSSYLEKHFRKSGCGHVIRIPILVDTEEPKWSVKNVHFDDNVLRLGYAGNPGKKDLLGNAIRGVKCLKDDGFRVKLVILGPSKEVVVACVDGDIGLVDALGDAIEIRGRVPQEDVPKIMGTCDFSVLLRPNLRYAEAGFPTKLVESLAIGLPVIANPTSDIGRYVEHGRQGILLSGFSVPEFVTGVKQALSLTPSERASMRSFARERAVESFDFRQYVNVLSEFLVNR